MDPSGQLLRMREVACALNISRRSAYQLAAQGHIPSVRFGRTVRVRAEDLAQFIQASLSPTANESGLLSVAQPFLRKEDWGENV